MDLLRVDQVDLELAIHVTLADLLAAGDPACRHLDVLCGALDLGDDRLAGLDDLVDLPAQGLGDERDRLREADVADDAAVGDALFELLDRGADALAGHDRGAERREVVDARSLDAVDAHADGAPHDDQRIEHEAGVDAGAQDGDLVLLGEAVEHVGALGVAGPRVGEFLGDADHVGAGLDGGHDLRLDLVQVGLRVDADDVGLGGQHLLEVGGHLDVTRLAEQLAHRLALFGRVGDDAADQLDVLGPIEDELEEPLPHFAGAPFDYLDHVSASTSGMPSFGNDGTDGARERRVGRAAITARRSEMRTWSERTVVALVRCGRWRGAAAAGKGQAGGGWSTWTGVNSVKSGFVARLRGRSWGGEFADPMVWGGEAQVNRGTRGRRSGSRQRHALRATAPPSLSRSRRRAARLP